MGYAIISVGGKQYRVREGERLLVDRLAEEDGKTFTPPVLLVGGNGDPQIAPSNVVVTAKVLGQLRGPKIRIGKYKKRTGYKRHAGFRAALTQIEIESIGGKKRAAAKPKAEAAPKPKADTEVVAEVVEAAAVTVEVETKPKAVAKPRAAAKPKAAPAAEPDVAAETAKEDES